MQTNKLGSSGAASADPAADNEISLFDLVNIVKPNRLLIASTVLVALVLSGAYLWLATPQYEVDALLQVELTQKPLDAALGDLTEAVSGSAPVTAELQILTSRLVLGSVVDQLDLDIRVRPKYLPVFGRAMARSHTGLEPADPFFGLSSYGWGGEQIVVNDFSVPDSQKGRLWTLTAGPAGTYTLDGGGVSLEGNVGRRLIAGSGDGTIEIFVGTLRARAGTKFELYKLHRDVAIQALKSNISIKELGSQSGVVRIGIRGTNRKRLVSTVNQIATIYQRQNVERRSAEAEQTLAFLGTQLPKVRGELEAAEAALNTYRLKQGSADLTKETELVLQQSVVIESRRLDLAQKREELLQRYTPKHPVIQALDSQVAELERERAQISDQVQSLPDTQQELLRLARGVEVYTSLYTSLLNSAQELEVVRAGTVGNVRIVDYGLVPSKPVSPKTRVVLLLGLVLGLIAGIALAIIRRALADQGLGPRDIETKLGLATFATIPFTKVQERLFARSRTGNKRSILADVDPQNVAVEAVRSLRTAMNFAQLEAKNNVIMITGPAPSLGKSFVSINLGSVAAVSQRSTVVVDADMRRGHLHEYVHHSRTLGLSEYVAGDASYEDVVQPTHIDGLRVITTGLLPPNPAELLLHERFAELLERLSEDFDQVIVDTPPVLAVTDASIVGRLCGTTLLLLKAGAHSLSEVQEALHRLDQAGVRVSGAIFNQVGRGQPGYSSQYSYGYNYEYRQSEQALRAPVRLWNSIKSATVRAVFGKS